MVGTEDPKHIKGYLYPIVYMGRVCYSSDERNPGSEGPRDTTTQSHYTTNLTQDLFAEKIPAG